MSLTWRGDQYRSFSPAAAALNINSNWKIFLCCVWIDVMKNSIHIKISTVVLQLHADEPSEVTDRLNNRLTWLTVWVPTLWDMTDGLSVSCDRPEWDTLSDFQLLSTEMHHRHQVHLTVCEHLNIFKHIVFHTDILYMGPRGWILLTFKISSGVRPTDVAYISGSSNTPWGTPVEKAPAEAESCFYGLCHRLQSHLVEGP